MKKTVLFIIFVFFTIYYCSSQNEASNWYFGENAGIKFNVFTGEVTPLSDGQINTREGCASISNSSGELLFYTDGTTVYNALHQIMSNGEDLLGDESSTQSAIVVPKPNNSDIYYVFTVGSNQNNTGLNYSTIDVSANGGEGQVTSKNNNLLPQCAEKISAVVKDCETKSIWVVTLANSSGTGTSSFDTFYAYEVNDFGVSTIPVKSTFNSISITDARGYLKVSPDGSKIACANVPSGLYLFDFDSETGRVSNSYKVNINDQNNKPYGVEFSPNSEFLYVTSTNDYFNNTDASENNNPANHYSILLQYNLKATDISGSMFVLNRGQGYRGGIQLGPNGKIYRALSESYNSGFRGLGVINNPNELGTNAFYEHNAVTLTSNSTQGLPPFIASFFNQQIDIIKNGNDTAYLPLCVGDSYTLSADEIPGATYTWTRDGALLPEADFDLVVTETGTYKVVIEPPGNVLTNNCGLPQGEATVEFFNYPQALDASLFQCDLDLSSVGITTFNLAEANEIISRNTDVTITFYYSANDALNNTNPILGYQSYENSQPNEVLYTRVTHNISGCFETATLNLGVSNTQVETFIAEPVCDDVDSPDGINIFQLDSYSDDIANELLIPNNDIRVKFYETIDDALLETNEVIEYQNNIPYQQTLFYRVETISNNECYGINEIQLNIDKLPDIIKEEGLYYCLNKYPETIKLNAGLTSGFENDFTYEWSNGETTYEIDINEVGTYNVQVTNAAGCSNERVITVEASNTATISSIEIEDVTANNKIVVIASGEGIYEYALVDENGIELVQYQQNNVFENVSPGIYYIRIRDTKGACGFIDTIASVVGFPKFFTPNNDGVHDTWQVLGVSEMFQPNSKIFIYDRYGKLLKQISPLGNGWDGTFNGSKLPSDDYWFSVELQDGRIFKNHFSLKL